MLPKQNFDGARGAIVAAKVKKCQPKSSPKKQTKECKKMYQTWETFMLITCVVTVFYQPKNVSLPLKNNKSLYKGYCNPCFG